MSHVGWKIALCPCHDSVGSGDTGTGVGGSRVGVPSPLSSKPAMKVTAGRHRRRFQRRTERRAGVVVGRIITQA